MRKWAVPDIVKQRGGQTQKALLIIKYFKAFKIIDNSAHDLIHTERMAETAVLGSVKREIGRAKLADAPQPLKLFCPNQLPYQRIAHMDVAMDGVFKYFFFVKLFVKHLR